MQRAEAGASARGAISIGIGIALGIGIEFGRAWLIRLQFFKPTVVDAEADHDADADSGEDRQSRKSAGYCGGRLHPVALR